MKTRGMDLATLKILRRAQTGVHVRLFSAVEPSCFNGSNRATGIKQKTHHKGTFFLLTGCGEWISLARHKVPAVRKFVVIRTSLALVLIYKF